MKLCFKCHREKPLDEFYRHPRMGDGHLGKCKDCAKADVIANRLAHVDYYREYDTDRYANNSVHRARHDAASKNYNDNNPEKRKAHQAVTNAVRDRRLLKNPCRDCPRTDVHGHHTDYSRPLDVIWLCPVHHRAEHERLKRSFA